MVNLIVGVKGTGKTKILMEHVNQAATVSRGNVVCVEYGKKLTFNVFSKVRLIDVLDYNVSSGDELYGFMCGILAGNYDITELFIDGALKICKDDMQDFEKFFIKFNDIIVERNIHCLITASTPEENLTESLKSFVTHG